MRTYIAEVVHEYFIDSDFKSSVAENSTFLYDELDKESCVAVCESRFGFRRSLSFCVMVYNKPFVDNTEFVKDQVVKACEIWDLGFDKDLWKNLLVRESNALQALSDATTQGLNSLRCMLNIVGANELYDLFKPSSNFATESFIDIPRGKDALLKGALQSKFGKNLAEEVRRIYKSAEALAADDDAHNRLPVHYILEGAGSPAGAQGFNVLASALQDAGRVPSTHVYKLNFDCLWDNIYKLDFMDYLNDNLASCFEDNLLLIQYSEPHDDKSLDLKKYRALTKLIGLLNNHLDRVQVVFMVAADNKESAQRLAQRLQAPVVTIAYQKGAAAWNQTDAYDRLAQVAQRCGVKPSASMESLLAKYQANRSDRTVEQIFDDWQALTHAQQSYPLYHDAYQTYLEPPARRANPMQRLQELIGLSAQKQLVQDIVLRIKMNRTLAKLGQPTRNFSMHMVFLGNPGTGKTEVAKLYGEILRHEGILSEGRLIVTSGNELGSRDISQVFEKARGSVLFIDEAYTLIGCTNTVAELIACMENNREETVVILAGYSYHMEYLLDTNPGFRSRIGFTMEFADYATEELVQIFELMAKRAQVTLTDEARVRVLDMLSGAGRREDQGNARFVRKLFEDSLGAQQLRLARLYADADDVRLRADDAAHLQQLKHELGLLQACDIVSLADSDAIAQCGVGSAGQASKQGTGVTSAQEQLVDLIGLTEVKRVVSERLTYAKMQKYRRDNGFESEYLPIHMAFLGNPGTGKTEVARLIGKILKEEGILSVGDVYECGRADLVGPVVGSTAPKVQALFKRAKGSVIFIDEAYSLIDAHAHGFGDEAINAIVQCMENMRDDVVVIFAGYEQEMLDFMSCNPGLTSRIKTKVHFPNYSVDELGQILELMSYKRGFTLADDVLPCFKKQIAAMAQLPSFGNARVVRAMLEDAMVAQAVRMDAVVAEAAARDAGVVKENGSAKKAACAEKTIDGKQLMELRGCDFRTSTPWTSKRVMGFA
ncbi:MAG: AAA family ATPase [Atopobium sp.]|uniref:AAA family ATPase n=1 Tax=Atopobium sp. TaxID=1872650 RepID=UPI002A8176F9|nr:AAA family ATPase [Atopobium sp.]MDY4522199.1 AAA family ATPase [Atopobium sp.]